ncbi:hypothetical protein BMETH_3219_0 [methanotrophic bacterial endosymbiont of Bathymodiolus sp.]|nr:hypothetical protein BMETH_3219_0 [methanotrophic bacterial endosymbiont of Bathymodiolus sp.]
MLLTYLQVNKIVYRSMVMKCVSAYSRAIVLFSSMNIRI